MPAIKQAAAIELRQTELGWMTLAVRGGRLLALSYGHAASREALRSVGEIGGAAIGTDESLAAAWADRLEAVCRGEADELLDIKLDDSTLTPFSRKVTAACRRIRWGETVSYGELAARCDRPRAARAVGAVMARNPWPLVVPCHRVLAAGGGLGGYSAPQGIAMKQRLLNMESTS